MTIFYEINKAACDLVVRGVEPKAVILTRGQYQDLLADRDGASRLGWAGTEQRVPTVLGLPFSCVSGWDGPLVVGVPYPLPAFPKGFKLDAPMPKKTSLLAQRITRLADHVEEWPHNESKVMKALVKRLREFALDAAA